jgi:hypothetical protein
MLAGLYGLGRDIYLRCRHNASPRNTNLSVSLQHVHQTHLHITGKFPAGKGILCVPKQRRELDDAGCLF